MGQALCQNTDPLTGHQCAEELVGNRWCPVCVGRERAAWRIRFEDYCERLGESDNELLKELVDLLKEGGVV